MVQTSASPGHLLGSFEGVYAGVPFLWFLLRRFKSIWGIKGVAVFWEIHVEMHGQFFTSRFVVVRSTFCQGCARAQGSPIPKLKAHIYIYIHIYIIHMYIYIYM